MIAARTLSEMVEASPLELTKAAIVASLKPLMGGITVVSHPGKLDIADVVAKAVVQAPGIAVGWTRIRAARDLGGSFAAAVDWVAYIVAEERANLASRKAMSREAVAHGIGAFLLEILHDPEASVWGLAGLSPPVPEPGPELKPVFTARSFEAGTAYFAVTWTQELIDQGRPLFGAAPSPELAEEDGSIEAAWPDGDIPAEIEALIAAAEEEL